MRVLMISTDEKLLKHGSDVRRRHAEYARGFRELHVIVLSQEAPELPPLGAEPEKNLFVYSTESSSKISCLFDAMRIGRLIIHERGFRSDNSFITVQDPFFTSLVGIRLKSVFGIPLEIQIHTDIGSPYFQRENILNRIRFFLAKKHLPKADKIRVVSERIKQFLISDFKHLTSEIEVRPIAIDLERIKNAPITANLRERYPRFKKIILMASRLTEEKSIDTALEAFKNVVAKLPEAGLIIVGSGPEKKRLKEAAEKSGIGSSVVFEKWIDQNALFSYYKTADVFLSTSLYEGYGLSMMEAHSAGCKVVATDAGIAPEIAAPVCPVGDSKCLADQLAQILQ